MAVITSSEVINTGYAVLALIADALVVLRRVIAFIVSRTSPSARERWGRLRDGITPFALQIAWIVAVLATFGSLFLQFCEAAQSVRVLLVSAHLHVSALAAARHRGVPRRCAGREAVLHRPRRGRRRARRSTTTSWSTFPTSRLSAGQRRAVQHRGHQCLRIHLGPLPLDGRVPPDHDAAAGGTQPWRRLRRCGSTSSRAASRSSPATTPIPAPA